MKTEQGLENRNKPNSRIASRRLSRGQFILEMGLLVSGGLLVACSEPSTPTSKAVNTQSLDDKLFVSTKDGNFYGTSYLWLTNVDGSNQVLLEQRAKQIYQADYQTPPPPSWSPGRDKFLVPPGFGWASNTVYNSAGKRLEVIREGESAWWSGNNSVVYAGESRRANPRDDVFSASIFERNLGDRSTRTLALATEPTRTFKVTDLSVSPDKSKLAVSKRYQNGTGSLEVFDYKPGKLSAELPVLHKIQDSKTVVAENFKAEWTPDSRELVYMADNSLKVTEIENLSTRILVSGRRPNTNLASDNFGISPDGKNLVVGFSRLGISVIDLSTGQETALSKTEFTNWVSWLSDNNHIVFKRFSSLAIMDSGEKSIQEIQVAMIKPEEVPIETPTAGSRDSNNHPFGGRVSGKVEKLFWDLLTAEPRRYR